MCARGIKSLVPRLKKIQPGYWAVCTELSISLPGIRNARATAAGLSKGNFLAYKIKVPLLDCRLIIKILCCFYLQVLSPVVPREIAVLCLRNGPRVAQ
jgi:hypothetical protein